MSNTHSLMRICVRANPVMSHGQGSWLWDTQGRRYLDFVQGWAVNSLGHAPQILQQTLATQSAALLTPSPTFLTEPLVALARELTDATGLHEVFVCNSGAEATECAIKLARKWGRLHKRGAYRIVTAHNAFHGRTLAAMAASGKPGWDELFPPNLPGFTKVPFGDIDAIRTALSDDVAAVMLEPIQGEGGVVVPPAAYLAQVRALTQDRNVLLILDEVQTGMGRTGSLFRFQSEGVMPDILCVGKGLGAGFPVAAVAANQTACVFEPGDQGGTFAGAPLAAACALATLREINKPEFLAHVRLAAEHLRQRLTQLVTKGYLRSARGAGLLWALELPNSDGAALVAACEEQGLLLNSPRPNLLRLMPQLAVSCAEIDAMITLLEPVLAARV
jgi:acetylornithine/N-succinyldiaminopimelate aminotransferase